MGRSGTYYQLTTPQKNIWNVQRYYPETAIANVGGMIRFSKDYSYEKFSLAVNEIIKNNDAFRLRFFERNGEPYQQIEEYTYEEITRYDMRGKSEGEVDSFFESLTRKPIDPGKRPHRIAAVELESGFGLFMCLHHIICDAWSMALIAKEFLAAYCGEALKASSCLSSIDREKKYLESSRCEKDRQYWIKVFPERPMVCRIKEARETLNCESVRYTHILNYSFRKKIEEGCRIYGITPPALFETAMILYLHRVNEFASPVTIGIPVLGRMTLEEKDTIGMFVSTTPLCVDVDESWSVRKLCEAVMGTRMEAFRHQRYPISRILSYVREKSPETLRLYDIMVSFQNADVEGKDSDIAWYSNGCGELPLALHIEDINKNEEYRLHFDVQTEIFSNAETEMLCARFMDILLQILDNGDTLVEEIPIASQQEYHKVIYDFNDTDVEYPRHKCIHELFKEQVTKTPEAVAIIFEDKEYTYKQVDEMSNSLAHILRERGVERDDIVAIISRRSYKIIIAQLAILKAGGAYMPIDSSFSQERIGFIMQDAKCKIALTLDSFVEAVDTLDMSDDKIFYTDNSEIRNINDSEDLCYVIYTSGSTGVPKGAMVAHRNVVNFCNINSNMQKEVFTNCKAPLAIGSTTFDISVFEITLSLMYGQKIVYTNEKQMSEISSIAKLIKREKVDCIYVTPTRLKSFFDNGDFAKAVRHIKVFMIGGERASSELIEIIMQHSKAKIFNGYGPTEATVAASFGLIEDPQNIHIGGPIVNTQIYILDKYQNPMPVGVAGELCISGDGVGRGYLNRPELTAEKFVPSPFVEGKLMYKTGDLARWRSDGVIEYIGRVDNQVKIRGLRIELGEIETDMLSCEGIRQAAVVDVTDKNERQYLCAYYIGEEIDIKKVKKELAKSLPQYMIPHFFIRLESFPTTSSGKINRKAFPMPDFSNIHTDAEYVAPVTIREKALVKLLERVLGTSPIGMGDNFLDLGGDSLKAIELIAKLEQCGFGVGIQDVLNAQTISSLSDALKEKQVRQRKRAAARSDIPASSAQVRIYTAQSVAPNKTIYNIPIVLKSKKKIDAKKIEKACRALIDRHEILRTGFVNRNGKIIQIINKKVSFTLDTNVNFVRTFDLSKAPLLRVKVDGDTLMLDIHHIIFDGASMPIFLNELSQLYDGGILARPDSQYSDFTADALAYQSSPEYSENEKYWMDIFSGELPLLSLSTDRTRPQRLSYEGESIFLSFGKELTDKIKRLAQSMNITPFVYLMGGFNILLSKYSLDEDIIVGMPVSGRNDIRYMDTIGMFVNTVALRSKPTAEKTVEMFLQEVKENSIEAIKHQNYPFEDLVKALNIGYEADRNPVFDVMFSYQAEKALDITLDGEKLEVQSFDTNISKYDMTLTLIPHEDDLIAMAEYCTDLWNKSTIRRMLDNYKALLSNMMENTQSKLSDISAITADEYQKVIFDFNLTAYEYPSDKCIHELFETQAQKKPGAVAIVFEGEEYTYRQVDEMSNSLAHILREKGIGREDIVAIISRRSHKVLIAQIAVLKAGGAYIPIDPNYPKDRIDFMLRDAKCKLSLSLGIEALNGEAIDMGDESVFNGDTDSLDSVNSPSDLCYLIFTSGSTGKPKGTMLTHRNVVNYCSKNDNNVVNKIVTDEMCNVLSVTTIGFDIFVTESLMPLVNGLKVIFANDQQANVQSELNALIMNSDADVMQTTPSKMNILMLEDNKNEYLKKLKVIILGGEALESAVYERLRKFTKAKIFNIYGPTETTVWSSNVEVTSSDITIGKPIANTQMYILDKRQKPMPIGCMGELCISGEGVGRGYLNRPELTAEKFIPNPFVEGERIYRTGDLAKWRENGEIEYLGRIDNQVKIRGLRIELGEIENAMVGFSGIRQAVVVDKKDEAKRQYLCAYYSGEEIEAKKLRTELSKILPQYMVPIFFTRLESFPTTGSGKTDRNALPMPDFSKVQAATEYIAPATEKERAFIEVWEEVLDISPIGMDDNFFDIGGDSLRAIELVAKAHNAGFSFALQNVFDFPTAKSLLKCMETGDKITVTYAESDFSKFDIILKQNEIDWNFQPVKKPIGNLLLTGATGFLGAHILDAYLSHEKGTVYCLVRGENQRESQSRLRDVIEYYFADKYKDSDRIIAVCADVSGTIDTDLPVDMVIHSAAAVKHYGSYRYFYDMNVVGTKNVVLFAKQKKAKFIHISTLSVSGNSFTDEFSGYVSKDEKYFYESSLFIDQPFENVYSRSKFEAEVEVLSAALEGLDANIIRMGNLTNRFTDLQFQSNHEQNAFVKRVKAVLEFGMFPDYLLPLYAEFSPIDFAADAVIRIAGHFNSRYSVFHVNSNKPLYFERLLKFLKKTDINMHMVDGITFAKALMEAARQMGTEYIYEALMNDLDSENRLVYDSNIRIENDFTVWYLSKLGFSWPEIDEDYFVKYITYFRSIGYLEV